MAVRPGGAPMPFESSPWSGPSLKSWLGSPVTFHKACAVPRLHRIPRACPPPPCGEGRGMGVKSRRMEFSPWATV